MSSSADVTMNVPTNLGCLLQTKFPTNAGRPMDIGIAGDANCFDSILYSNQNHVYTYGILLKY